ncbi:hypothetical protein BDZ91DRAFT_769075 [Kalaharituber pfeilii]|nr:hypothetical protein BDZ91DRAFT_769075 [Kalaharituber pfeilii]
MSYILHSVDVFENTSYTPSNTGNDNGTMSPQSACRTAAGGDTGYEDTADSTVHTAENADSEFIPGMLVCSGPVGKISHSRDGRPVHIATDLKGRAFPRRKDVVETITVTERVAHSFPKVTKTPPFVACLKPSPSAMAFLLWTGEEFHILKRIYM